MTRSGDVVVYASPRVYRFSRTGRLVASWGTASRFGARGGIAVDADGRVIGFTGHHDPRGPQVITCDGTGRVLARWGAAGHDPGQLFDPLALAVDAAGRVYVADADDDNPRVMVFDTSGRFLHQWDVRAGSAAGLTFPLG